MSPPAPTPAPASDPNAAAPDPAPAPTTPGLRRAEKRTLSRPQRLLRLIGATLDPRAWAHAVKLVNYYNYTHLREVRQMQIGPDCAISPNASFANGRNITLGRNVLVSAHVCLWAGPGTGRITLGDNVLIAPGVMITTTNYRFNDGAPINAQDMDEADIEIGEDVWIGYGAVVLPGTRIGAGAIIGAGAVVRGDIAPGAIMAGAKAGQIGTRHTPPA